MRIVLFRRAKQRESKLYLKKVKSTNKRIAHIPEFGIRDITRCSCDSTMKLGQRRTLSLAKGERLMEPDETSVSDV